MEYFRTSTQDEDTVSSSWHSQNTSRSIQTPSTAATQHSERFYESRQYPDEKPAMSRSASGQHHIAPDEQSRALEASSDASSELSVDDRLDFEPDSRSAHLHALPTVSERLAPDIVASNSQTFARHFPSDDRILVRHDGTTRDGNMNLRCDTIIPAKYSGKQALTLFHLRMHNLKDREFSLRRYCRDSGREVCRTERVYQDAPDNRQHPNLYRSLSYALSLFKRQNSCEVKPPFSPKQHAFRALNEDEDGEEEEEERRSHQQPKRRRASTNTISLEFSNYTHIDISRKGRGTKKCYTFEYWGVQYSWRRQTKQEDGMTVVSYHLFKDNQKWPSAHVVSDILSQYQMLEEQARGGWVPQCSLWIKDLELIKFHSDVAEVVVATGLVALVDDTIKRTWPRKDSSKKRFSFVPSLNIGSNSASASAPTSPTSSKPASRPTSSRHASSATGSNKTKYLMNAVFRPPMLYRRQNTVPEQEFQAPKAGLDSLTTGCNGQPYGPYRRRTTA